MFRKSNKNSRKAKNQAERISSRRQFLNRGKIAAGFAAAAAAIGLTPFSPAYAASTSGSSGIEIKPLIGAKAQRYIQAVFNSQDFQKFEKEVSGKYAGTFSQKKAEASALVVTSSQGSLVAARVPLAGGTGDSFYSATFVPDT